jgi:hypothetical protein
MQVLNGSGFLHFLNAKYGFIARRKTWPVQLKPLKKVA